MSELRWIPLIFALIAAFGFFGYIIQSKFRLLLATQHRARFFAQLPLRFANVFVYAFGQKKMFKEPKSGIMHALIFWGFLVLQIRTLYLMVCAFYPGAQIPWIHHEYTIVKEFTAVIVLAAVVYAVFRRVVTRPKRLTFSGEALVVLGMISGLMISDILLDAATYALAQTPQHFHYALFFDWPNLTTAAERAAALDAELAAAPVAAWVSGAFANTTPQALLAIQEASYWIHMGIVLVFLNLLPGSKHFHVLTAIPNVFFADLKRFGAIEPILDMEERETFGVGTAEDFTWKQVLDTYTCTECGRCEVNCPTTISGKVLNPKKLITDIRDHLYAREAELVHGEKGITGWETEKYEISLVEDVKEDAIWDCTTCRACSEACPVMIDHIDKVIDLRRHLVLMEASFPSELTQTFKNLESRGNPWGLPAQDRDKWAEGLDIPLLEDAPDAEYVFWVGCAGSYDDRQKKISRALVELLRRANVTFAFLGNAEICTGDPARRAGNEYLYQQQAKANIEMMQEKGVDKKKLVTHCPHCLNMIQHEYPQLGGDFEIIHHTVLIEKLISEGRLTPKKTTSATKITYHDSCYLGRHNGIYEQPRDALKVIPGVELKEMTRNRTTAMCCGAGGARAWMEETRGKRINHMRVDQAVETGAEVVAVACPFCNMMMEDGIGAKGAQLKSVDVAELVLESLGD